MKSVDLATAFQTEYLSRREQASLVLRMSLPAILAQLTSIAMEYIDAAMVGSLGANATGAIGLVSSTTWLIGGMCIGMTTGFSVQVAQLIGAGREKEARNVLRQSFSILLMVSLIVALISGSISQRLPIWLGGEADVVAASATYFLIFSCAIPFHQMRQLSASMLQCSGDMKTPSILAALVCLLDVVFNMFFIFPTRMVSVGTVSFLMPGAGLGVTGAAIGTALSEVVVSILMVLALVIRSPKLSLKHPGSWKWEKVVIVRAIKIAIPMTLDHVFMCSAYVAGTVIVAPLGTVSVAANSLAVTAESLCYMPGYGIGSASTAIVGQSIGADRRDLTRSFARLAVLIGMVLMGIMGVVMYFLAPGVFHLLTSDPSVAELGTKVLRLELVAEPFYAAAIVCAGVFRGAGDTLKPSIMNLVSMWGVRIILASVLVPRLGLAGYWIAMGIELGFRGVIFLIRLFRERWMKKAIIAD